MTRWTASVIALILLPATSGAEVAIQHDAVGCVVAGQYPVLEACLTPAGEVARARIMFRSVDTALWYHVQMKPRAGCYAGTLPKPRKDIGGGGFLYYVEGFDRAFSAVRTAETRVRVVSHRNECEKDVPVAPFVDKATVVVGVGPGAPAIPAGFMASGIAAGAAGAVTAAVVGGGALATGAIVTAVSGGGGAGSAPSTAATLAPVPTTLPLVAPSTTTPPATTVPPATNLPPAIVLDYSPQSGRSPLEVRFNACRSTDVDGDVLRYAFDFESDGIVDAAGGPAICRQQYIYVGDPGKQARARVCVNDRVPGHADVCATARIDFDPLEQGPSTSLPAASREPHLRPSDCEGRACDEPSAAAVGITWVSEITADGSLGQMILNGRDVFFPGPGRAEGKGLAHAGENRIEAVLAAASGAGGTWRFQLTGEHLEPGSVRPVAGEVTAADGTSVTFRIHGKVGERVSIAFRSR